MRIDVNYPLGGIQRNAAQSRRFKCRPYNSTGAQGRAYITRAEVSEVAEYHSHLPLLGCYCINPKVSDRSVQLP